jgi:hypothetical protein
MYGRLVASCSGAENNNLTYELGYSSYLYHSHDYNIVRLKLSLRIAIAQHN